MSLRYRRLLISGSAIFLPSLSGAAETASKAMDSGVEIAARSAPISTAQDPMAVSSLLQLTLGMLLVLGLIVALAWLVKRSGRFQFAAGGGLRILGGLSMGARERLVLVQVGDTQLLVGVAPGRVQTLHVLDQPIQAERSTALPAAGSFTEHLQRLINKNKSSST